MPTTAATTTPSEQTDEENSGSVAPPTGCSLLPNDGNGNPNDRCAENSGKGTDKAAKKARKRLLNKHLKQRNKLRKYETRVQQGILRKDKSLEEEARKDWENYKQLLQNDPNSVLNYTGEEEAPGTTASVCQTGSHCCQLNQSSRYRHSHQSLRSSEDRETKRVREGGAWLLKFWMKMAPLLALSSPPSNNDNDSPGSKPITSKTTKEQQTIRAAKLKANMDRGTQTESMFDDDMALLGYTRQKFYERALLAFASLDRLDPCHRENEGDAAVDGTEGGKDGNAGGIGTPRGKSAAERKLVDGMWGRLIGTKQVVSIGCGPGCDATGVLAFFESHGAQLENGILLMDFVVDRWKQIVLDQLIERIVPRYVPFVRAVGCDVRDSLLPTEQHPNKQDNKNHRALLELRKESPSRNRLIVVSYLLTETRHKWKSFFHHLLSMLQGTESLLLLTEPTAWQLHEFLACFSSSDADLVRAHVWLDSSRDLPHMQSLDKRNGPAILMVCTH
ncbi:unnamed protein product [Pseudo-nitzschia multistriata]|uniref:Uncharacterized protein n=1 Tax=Pseudo-nitzschia multistriata TaxID=183589 RepID=A0A448Z287_9STRA|nr:unnamed protein product [Pseudo-nitzschia multistriata]